MTAERVLITGGGGFLGGHLARAFAARDWAVRVLDPAAPVPPQAGVESRAGSVLDEPLLKEALTECTVVVHAAAMTDLWARDMAAFDRINRGGTALVARLSRQRGVRMIHVSSYTTLVARRARKGMVTDETALIAPEHTCGPYPAAKRRAELAVLAEVERGLDGKIVLPAAPVGPGDRRPSPPGRLLRDLARGALPALLETTMNMADAEAMAEAIVTAAAEKGGRGERYLLSGENWPLGRIAGLVEGLGFASAPQAKVPFAVAFGAALVESGLGRFGRAPAAPLTGVRIAGRAPIFRNDTARAALGFAPPPLEESIARSLHWMVREEMIPPARPRQAS